MSRLRRVEAVAIVVAVLLLVVAPPAVSRARIGPADFAVLALVVLSGVTLVGWRRHPRAVAVVGLGLSFGATVVDGWAAHTSVVPDSAMLIVTALCTVAGTAWHGRELWWVVGAGVVLLELSLVVQPESPVGLLMFTVPGFVVGAVYRARNETARELAVRAKELEDEQELFAQIVRRHERARIAAELHDIIGHAMSVMVIQAAAGQRLSTVDADRTEQVFAAIAESARQGRRELRRLVELLGGDNVPGPDLALIDELVDRACDSGLKVSCVVAAERDAVDTATAHVAFRVVQESLTNALRHAPGAEVNAYVGLDGDALAVRVENDASSSPTLSLVGTRTGLDGLRQRVEQSGGRLRSGPTARGGWLVEATIPVSRAG
ncbi:sensor histidine kinase [Calidifontibacter indicus]|uniref:sensor histidine kinase n=1 Tax=Calidifontibacter indicus TaxID=419650 RepID=UPI003D724DC4